MFPGYMLEEFSCLGMLLSPLSLSMSPSLYKFTSRPVLGKSVDKANLRISSCLSNSHKTNWTLVYLPSEEFIKFIEFVASLED